ncbi:hypothetical protein RHMOL_Rhmol06G0255300 [Rhododendron molle]|uniref:Uncharacterized protein n=1 Tax=Rhododendron molle TaxID=49168 RepID=A0ACC0NII4_RHOML|nr:hypothetical protein RHMOL_Rhmol06G0255300 [Rhododendron molle]
MAKTRFVTEVAPSKLISRTKRPLRKKLDTIYEEERDFDANGSLSTPFGSSSDREPSYRLVEIRTSRRRTRSKKDRSAMDGSSIQPKETLDSDGSKVKLNRLTQSLHQERN